MTPVPARRIVIEHAFEVGMLPSCMYGAVSAMFRSVGALNFPTSAGYLVNS